MSQTLVTDEEPKTGTSMKISTGKAKCGPLQSSTSLSKGVEAEPFCDTHICMSVSSLQCYVDSVKGMEAALLSRMSASRPPVPCVFIPELGSSC